MSDILLDVQNLKIEFNIKGTPVAAVDDVSFHINAGEVYSLVGESGCGKSTTAMGIMRLVSKPGRIAAGSLLFGGKDLLKLDLKEMPAIRGKEIGMIFQNPLDSLNPVYTVGSQIAEGLLLDNISKEDAWNTVYKVFNDVQISDPEQRIRSFPHEISGGMRQRIMIGMMLSRNPKLLIADEPTTALDVTIQAGILSLMQELQAKFNTAILVITHDFGIIAEVADRVGVMYAGKLVEECSVLEIFDNPVHPYTSLLMQSLPKITKKEGRLTVIPGAVPTLTSFPKGCRFHPRCPHAEGMCQTDIPPLKEISPGHYCACHREV